mmetsp:Transcript_175063/g.561409  ORF Transcript_175063/g.561409 Transcript_175063/m.561409 type:complete len:239 (+) Transcript_175063:134-850(+)
MDTSLTMEQQSNYMHSRLLCRRCSSMALSWKSISGILGHLPLQSKEPAMCRAVDGAIGAARWPYCGSSFRAYMNISLDRARNQLCVCAEPLTVPEVQLYGLIVDKHFRHNWTHPSRLSSKATTCTAVDCAGGAPRWTHRGRALRAYMDISHDRAREQTRAEPLTVSEVQLVGLFVEKHFGHKWTHPSRWSSKATTCTAVCCAGGAARWLCRGRAFQAYLDISHYRARNQLCAEPLTVP